MPPIESYQRVELQNSDDSSRQINKKSIDHMHSTDQTHSEARIENRSVRDAIEDTSLALGSAKAGQSSDVAITAPIRNNAGSASSVIDRELVLNPRTTVGQSEGSNASINLRKGVNEDSGDANEQPVGQFIDASSDFPDSEFKSAMRNEDVIERYQNHMDVADIVSGSSEGVGASNTTVAEQSIKLEDDAQIDSVENLTVEQAFDFLTQQTEDTYVP